MLYLGAKKSLLSSGKTLAQQIAALFAGGEQGAWYEPSLANGTLFQDSAGVTPVTAVGQQVGLMLDKSGRGNHARQITTINRPVLQIDAGGRYFLTFNGTNSWMSTAAIDFTGTDKMTLVAGVRKLSDAAIAIVAELSVDLNVNPGSFYLLAPPGAALTSIGWGSRGTGTNVIVSATGLPSPVSAVVTCLTDVSAPLRSIRKNGGLQTSVSSSLGTGNFGNYPIYVGARAGANLFFNGNLYGLVVRGALSSDAQITSAEKFMNSKTGAF